MNQESPVRAILSDGRFVLSQQLRRCARVSIRQFQTGRLTFTKQTSASTTKDIQCNVCNDLGYGLLTRIKKVARRECRKIQQRVIQAC